MDIVDAFNKIGYSKAEVRRLLKSGAIKIWDTRCDGGHFEWYKRRALPVELVEPDDVLMFGHPKVLVIKKKPFPMFKRLFYWARPFVERRLEAFCN